VNIYVLESYASQENQNENIPQTVQKKKKKARTNLILQKGEK